MTRNLSARIIKRLETSVYPKIAHHEAKEIKAVQSLTSRLNERGSGYFGNKEWQKDMYQSEDSSIDTYKRYIHDLLRNHGLLVDSNGLLGRLKYFGSLVGPAKHHFKRSRPSESAQDLRMPLQIQPSHSADSPSFPSGHAFQGMLFGVLLYNNVPSFFKRYPNESDKLAAFAVDVGFRRVYAGLHFPSDCVGSLWMIFELCIAQKWDVHPLLQRYNELFVERMPSYTHKLLPPV